ncbi:hypothetical protein HD806DRAFT_187625 [Xylariaceae sp. AK1471]|nr:hypothetical protein HD806DRAFT_187625 [Xylariaceae sp. AK1471]
MKTSIIKILAAVAFTLPSHLAGAAPNVTAIPIGTACTSYPGYDGVNAGPFIAVADSTGQAVDGTGVNAAYFVENHHRYGYVMAPAAVPTWNITMRCANNTLQAQLNMTDTGEMTWQDLVISGDPNLEGVLGFGFLEDKYKSIPLEPYWHFVDDQQVPGVYLGARDSTTFGFVDNSTDVAGEYYLLRLLGTEGFNKWELGKRDTTGFLKVTYSY